MVLVTNIYGEAAQLDETVRARPAARGGGGGGGPSPWVQGRGRLGRHCREGCSRDPDSQDPAAEALGAGGWAGAGAGEEAEGLH